MLKVKEQCVKQLEFKAKNIFSTLLSFFCLFFLSNINAEDSLSLREQLIQSRIEPMSSIRISGQVTQTASSANKKSLSNKELYNKYCTLCHSAGVAGAPRLGNKADWTPRIKKGLATLKKHALSGYKAMPAKGTCMECSSKQIVSLIQFMIDKVK